MALDQGAKPQLISHELKAGLSWRLFVTLFIVFFSLVLIYLGMEFGYKTFLRSSITSLEAQMEETGNKVGETEQQNLILFYSQLFNLKTLLNRHVFSSNLFDFLERNTHPNVVFSDLDLNTATGELTLNGIASSYSALVSQISHLESQRGVRSVSLGQNSLDRGAVRFSAKINFVPNFFYLTSGADRSR